MKIYAFEVASGRKVDMLPECQFSVEELSASHSTDLQQRASELQAVVSLDDTIESIMPSDASCEDIEPQDCVVGPSSLNDIVSSKSSCPLYVNLPAYVSLGLYSVKTTLSLDARYSSERPWQ